IATGMWTVISRLDWLRIFQRPSSRLSLWAANSNRAACASQGLVSCEITVVMPSPNYVQHHLTGSAERNTCAARIEALSRGWSAGPFRLHRLLRQCRRTHEVGGGRRSLYPTPG